MKDIFSGLVNKALCKYYNVAVGKNFRCEGRLVIQGHGKYTIGNNVHIISTYRVNPVGGDKTVLQTLEGGEIKIGNNCGLSHAILCARQYIEIQDDVLVGGGTAIYDNDFHSLLFDQRMESPDTHINSNPVTIKKGAFVGARSIILKGVTIGEKSIIGAGSVVTKSVPDGEIWAGNPAAYIRKTPLL